MIVNVEGVKLNTERFQDEGYRNSVSLPEGYAWFLEQIRPGTLHNWVVYSKEDFRVIRQDFGDDFLKANRLDVKLPINCKSCHNMFGEMVIPDNTTIKLDTTGVTTMSYMFHDCKFGDFCTLELSDTTNVEYMYGMFFSNKIGSHFSLGKHFNTGKVKSMREMFYCAEVGDGFLLGDEFDTSSLRDMDEMFYHAKFKGGLSLGEKFNTANVENMDSAFALCEVDGVLDLGDWFICSEVTHKYNLFNNSKTKNSLSLEERLELNNSNKGNKLKCKQDLIWYLQAYNSLVDALCHLKEDNYNNETISFVVNECKSSLKEPCLKELKACFNLAKNSRKTKTGLQSYYTIAEAKKYVEDKGYPIEIVAECICELLGDLCISE